MLPFLRSPSDANVRSKIWMNNRKEHSPLNHSTSMSPDKVLSWKNYILARTSWHWKHTNQCMSVTTGWLWCTATWRHWHEARSPVHCYQLPRLPERPSKSYYAPRVQPVTLTHTNNVTSVILAKRPTSLVWHTSDSPPKLTQALQSVESTMSSQ